MGYRPWNGRLATRLSRRLRRASAARGLGGRFQLLVLFGFLARQRMVGDVQAVDETVGRDERIGTSVP